MISFWKRVKRRPRSDGETPLLQGIMVDVGDFKKENCTHKWGCTI